MESNQIQKLNLTDYQIGETLGTGKTLLKIKGHSVESESLKIKPLVNLLQ